MNARPILLHAFPLDCRMWADVRNRLGEAGHAVSAPDLPGPVAEPALGAWADRLLRSVDGPVVPVGCSMGGYLAFELLRRAPERVPGIGLVATRAGAETEESLRGRAETIALLEDEGGPALWERLGPRLFGPEAPEAAVARARELALEQGTERLVAAVQAIRDREDSRDLLAATDVPAVVVHGTEDAIIPVAEAEAMAEALPRARLELVAGSGHLVPLERPEVVARAILDLLDEVRR